MRHGHSAEALYWSSEKIQQLHFRILLEIGTEDNGRVLDDGYVFGDRHLLLGQTTDNTRCCNINLSPCPIATAKLQNFSPQQIKELY